MKRITTFALSIGFGLTLLAQPTFAQTAPTPFSPEYQKGKIVYIEPGLAHRDISPELANIGKANQIGFLLIAQNKTPDMPPVGAAKVVGDAASLRFARNPNFSYGDNFALITYVRNNDGKGGGSFSVVVGGKWREILPANVLQEIQTPILKQYARTNIEQAELLVAKELDARISSHFFWAAAWNVFWKTIAAGAFTAAALFLYGLYLIKRKELEDQAKATAKKAAEALEAQNLKAARFTQDYNTLANALELLVADGYKGKTQEAIAALQINFLDCGSKGFNAIGQLAVPETFEDGKAELAIQISNLADYKGQIEKLQTLTNSFRQTLLGLGKQIEKIDPAYPELDSLKTQFVGLMDTNNDPQSELASLKSFEGKLAEPIALANRLSELALAIESKIADLTKIDGYLAENGILRHHSYSGSLGLAAPSPKAIESYRSSLGLALSLPFGERLQRLQSLFTELDGVYEPIEKLLSKRADTLNLLTKTINLPPLNYLAAHNQLEEVKTQAKALIEKGDNQNWGLAFKEAQELSQSAEKAAARGKKYSTLRAKANSLNSSRRDSLNRYFELEDWNNIEQCITTWENEDYRAEQRAKARREQAEREAKAERDRQARIQRERDRASTVIISSQSNYYGGSSYGGSSSSSSSSSWGSDSGSSSSSWGSDSGSSSSDSSSDSGSSSSDW